MIRRWLPLVALATSTLAIGVSVALWFDARDARGDLKQAICESRNRERLVHRQNFNDQIAQTRNFPAVVFERLQIDRADAVAALEARRSKLDPLDCAKQTER